MPSTEWLENLDASSALIVGWWLEHPEAWDVLLTEELHPTRFKQWLEIDAATSGALTRLCASEPNDERAIFTFGAAVGRKFLVDAALEGTPP